ncbi:MAG: hypothetical protein A2289_20330 [Deltaproteobacteria bacterium RIFOXYA12_FULL_58_15]|nr:MAG: hypothetical protein A2289_20330 [Deltaproteobacteria bacterium RIFOXYA12_FULL_58_15]
MISFWTAILWLPIAIYLGTLALLASPLRQPPRRRQPTRRFVIVVPAHNEELSISTTVKNLFAVDYPSELRRVVVVADNCTDTTVDKARAAGAEVVERNDTNKHGKGYALDYVFTKLIEHDDFDAVVVVDADTIVSANLLDAFDNRLEAGALAVQAEYGVRNIHDSWRTKLIAIALAMFHHTRSLARERLHVSVGLRGNGMCFARSLLKNHPHRVHSLVEDVEFGIVIGLAGIRVAYASEAEVLGEMATSGKAAVSQRRRWEVGRWVLVRQYLGNLIAQAFRRRSLTLADLAMDIMVPPLSYVGLVIAGGLSLETVISLWRISDGAESWMWIGTSGWLWVSAAACLGLYVLRGVQYSGLGVAGLGVLMFAPVYVLWKVVIARPFRQRSVKSWVRTQRESETVPEDE